MVEALAAVVVTLVAAFVGFLLLGRGSRHDTRSDAEAVARVNEAYERAAHLEVEEVEEAAVLAGEAVAEVEEAAAGPDRLAQLADLANRRRG